MKESELAPRDAGLETILGVLDEVSAGNLGAHIDVPEGADPAFATLAGRVNGVIDAWRRSEKKARLAKRELENKLATIEAQAAVIRELSTPIMEIWHETLLLPIVGAMNLERGHELMNALLESIVAVRARSVILDVTGVELMDTGTADYLLRVLRAARLAGAYCVISGIGPSVAQTVVHLGVDLSQVHTVRNLKEALHVTMARR